MISLATYAYVRNHGLDKPSYVMLFAAGSTRDLPSNDPRDFTIIPCKDLVSPAIDLRDTLASSSTTTSRSTSGST